MGNSGVFLQKTSEYLTTEAINRFNVRVVPDNTVLLSFKLTVGRVGIADGEMATNEAIAHFKLSPKAKLSSEYIYLYLCSFDYSQLGSTSSIAEAVNSKTIRDMKLLVPGAKCIYVFTETVAPLFSEIKSKQTESETLATLRDTLLPKLLSGDLAV